MKTKKYQAGGVTNLTESSKTKKNILGNTVTKTKKTFHNSTKGYGNVDVARKIKEVKSPTGSTIKTKIKDTERATANSPAYTPKKTTRVLKFTPEGNVVNRKGYTSVSKKMQKGGATKTKKR